MALPISSRITHIRFIFLWLWSLCLYQLTHNSYLYYSTSFELPKNELWVHKWREPRIVGDGLMMREMQWRKIMDGDLWYEAFFLVLYILKLVNQRSLRQRTIQKANLNNDYRSMSLIYIITIFHFVSGNRCGTQN